MQQKTQCDPDESRRGEAPNPAPSGAETAQAQPERESPSSGDSLMEAILSQENLRQALKRVKANKGAPGVDGISVSELPEHLKRLWPELRSSLLAGNYQPQPVRRVDIPKPGGGTRQ
ncbi:TPA: group II intron reverse transcriptase/maturase, partial [Salmonella enterica subsp. diarizonae]|nr:group II intron reverse transcriptase/maturase [Salmonella enterica subsp. diarizonae]